MTSQSRRLANILPGDFMTKAFFTACLLIFVSLQANASQNSKFTVMTYNVENLFDWQHDQGKEDYTYLPKSVKNKSSEVKEYCRSLNNSHYRSECYNLSWTPTVVRTKINNIAAMIKASAEYGPDVLVLQEVENINVIAMLLQWELSEFGYQTVELIEGPDRRGIDVAVISRFPRAKKSKLHIVKLPGNNPRPTRGILEVRLNVYGKDVAVFANHWPSQGNSNSFRMAAAETLHNATVAANTPYQIATGDFNTVSGENSGLSRISLHPDNPYKYYDVRSLVKTYADNPVYGTHWYRGHWDFLDKMLLFGGAMNVDIKLVPEYQRLVSPAFALIKTGKKSYRPKRFDARKRSGFSDHLPLMVGFRFQ